MPTPTPPITAPRGRSRDTVLVVGSTGYFGTGVVRELLLRLSSSSSSSPPSSCTRLRLLGRYRAGFERAGYLLPPSDQNQHKGEEEQQQQLTINDGTEGALECVRGL